jgi:hypothetical protein
MNSSPSLHLCFETAVRSRHQSLAILLIGATDIQFCARAATHFADLIKVFSWLPTFLASHLQNVPGQCV